MPDQYSWNQYSQTFTQPQNGLLSNPRTGLGRVGSAVAGRFFGLPGRLAANAALNRFGPGTRYGAAQNYNPTQSGYGLSDQEWSQFSSGQNLGFSQSPGASVTNQQLSDRFDANPSINLAERSGQPAQANAPIQSSQQQPNTQQQISQMPSAMQSWIRQNGLPQTPDDIRRATNAMYLDQSSNIAASNYGQDIGFIAPQARAPRQA